MGTTFEFHRLLHKQIIRVTVADVDIVVVVWRKVNRTFSIVKEYDGNVATTAVQL